MNFRDKKPSAEELIAKVIKHFGFRHQYEVAKYFGVTAQTLSGWVKLGSVPDKYLMKFELDVQEIIKIDNTFDKKINERKKVRFNDKKINDFSFTVFFADHIRALIIIPFVFSILSLLAVVFIIRPVFTSTAKVLPIADSGGSFSEMAGMASQLGLSMPMNFGNEIPWDEMFPEIIKSENLVESILNENFSSNKYGNEESLSLIIEKEYNIKNKSSIFLKKMIIHEFNEMIKVSKSRLSPIVTIELDFFEPQVAADILKKIIEVAGKTQIKIKLNQISEKRKFIEERILEVTTELKNAEIKFKEFKESNRRVEKSPSLKLEESRLEREVSLQTTLYMTLKSQFENVKIEEVEESAMIEVIDGPIVPFKVTRPKKISSVIFTFIFTFFSLFFFIYLRDFNSSGSKKHTLERIEARKKLFKNIKSLIPFIQK